jgi:hypothetical protein
MTSRLTTYAHEAFCQRVAGRDEMSALSSSMVDRR